MISPGTAQRRGERVALLPTPPRLRVTDRQISPAQILFLYVFFPQPQRQQRLLHLLAQIESMRSIFNLEPVKDGLNILAFDENAIVKNVDKLLIGKYAKVAVTGFRLH